jgi:hypothetical protein
MREGSLPQNEAVVDSPNRNPIASGRSCGTCTLCCKVVEVKALHKASGVWCAHCKPGVGCAIYSERPGECRDCNCGYLTNPDLGEEWKPSHSKIVVGTELAQNRIAVYVDPQRPDAWKHEPYYSRLKQWAKAAVPRRGQVLVCVAGRTYIVFPDRDVDLGFVGDDEFIMTTEQTTPLGVQLDASKIRKDDSLAKTRPRNDERGRP